MSEAVKPTARVCPLCHKPLQLNGVDESRKPPVAVYACVRCNVNFTGKVPS